MNPEKNVRTADQAKIDNAKADAAEVSALCETAAQYLMRLKDSAHGRWGKMAIEDLIDQAVDIKAAAREIVDGKKEDKGHE